MMYLFLLGGLFLGWSFGRNNLSTVFGTAIGTRMVSFRVATFLAGTFIFLGAILSGTQTTDAVLQLARIPSLWGAFLLSLSIGLTVSLASHFGIPVSIVESFIGAIIGWNFFFHVPNNWPSLFEMVAAWFYAPVLAAILAGLIFYGTQKALTHFKLSIFYRDLWIRFGLIASGIYSAYFLGANNISAIAGPYLSVEGIPAHYMILSIGIAIALGALSADKKVISTVSTGLFPLSALEAFIVVLSCGVILYCFSSATLQQLLLACHLPTLPLIPIPTTNVLIGCIVGVGATRGCFGIQWSTLGKMILSWFLIPMISGLICWSILAIVI